MKRSYWKLCTTIFPVMYSPEDAVRILAFSLSCGRAVERPVREIIRLHACNGNRHTFRLWSHLVEDHALHNKHVRDEAQPFISSGIRNITLTTEDQKPYLRSVRKDIVQMYFTKYNRHWVLRRHVTSDSLRAGKIVTDTGLYRKWHVIQEWI